MMFEPGWDETILLGIREKAQPTAPEGVGPSVVVTEGMCHG